MAAATSFPVAGGMPVTCLTLVQEAQLTTADIDFGAAGGIDVKVPAKCRVVGIVASVRAAGGSTPHTDFDVTVRKYDGSTGTNLVSAAMAVIDSSAIVAGGVIGALVTTEASLTLNAGDRLQAKLDVTGGSSPTIDGVTIHVYVVWLT